VKGTSGYQLEKIGGQWKKLPDEQSAFLCCYRRVTGTIKPSSKRWTGHIAGKGKK